MKQSEQEKAIEFNRERIYQKLDYLPEPKFYNSPVNWIVQNQIADTNGMHYRDRLGKLKEYPFYEMPVDSVNGDQLMLDIGSGWGRWLISGAAKGYVPVGIDLRLEFCKTQQKVLKDLNKKGYSIVADLESLPFKNEVFDLVWSYSVLQHTHIDRMTNCLKDIDKVLKKTGFTFLEFPNKNGIRNRNSEAVSWKDKWADYNNWSVRYYTPKEYEKIINKYLQNFSFRNHSFLGIGVLKEDLKYVSFKNKVLCSISLLLSFWASILPGLKNYSDSIYVKAEKKSVSSSQDAATLVSRFFQNHHQNSFDNLNIITLLKCPRSGGDLELSDDRQKVFCRKAGIYYPVVEDIPILIGSEGKLIGD